MKGAFWFLICFMTLISTLLIASSFGKCKSLRYFVITIIIFPFISLSLYLHWGFYPQLRHYWQLRENVQVVKSVLANIKSPQQVIDSLRSLLKVQPNRAKGWYLLGRLYMGEKKYKKSVAVEIENIKNTTEKRLTYHL